MSRKTAISELQAKETLDSHSPIRRSARIFSGNNTPSGLSKRNLQADIPAKVTKTRRGSNQLSEDDSDNSKKDIINKNSPQGPARRGRKSSVTTETVNKEEPERPKTIRTRRNSRAASEDKEKPPPKTVKGRKSSITSIELEVGTPSTSKLPGRRKRSESVDSEPAVPVSKAPSSRKRSESVDVKTEALPSTAKIPIRASTRRRNSVTEEAAVEGTSTPAKRTTRGRKASDSENVEEDVKSVLRRGLRSSADEATVNTPSKTPRRLTRRNSFTAEAPEEEPIEGVFKEVSIKITPIKKKLVEKVEAELDLSVINESSGDLNVSKQSLNEEVIVKDVEMAEHNLSVKVTPTRSVASEEVLVEKVSAGNAEAEALNESRFENSLPSKKRPRTDDNVASTSKSPKISSDSHGNSTMKLLQVLTPISPEGNVGVTVESVEFPLSSVSMPDSTTQTPDTEVDAVHTSKDINEENLDVEEVLMSKETPIKEGKVQEDVLSTSNDGNKEKLNIAEVFKSKDVLVEVPKVQEIALNIIIENDKENSNTEEFLKGTEISIEAPKAQEDALRISKKSNKENLNNEEIMKSKENPIEVSKVQEHTLNISKDVNKDNLDNEVLKSKNVCIEAPVVNIKISNVFRPNQKENSFVIEPMEVDDLSIISADNSIFDKISASGENSVVSGNAPKSDGVADITIKTLQESSSIFNKSITSGAEIELTTDVSSAVQDGDVTTVEKVIRINAAGSEESDNVVVEETENSVDISCIPKLKKTDTAAQANDECSLIVNTIVDNVKILNRKSSSPINQKKVLRKSRSPISVVDSSSDNEDEGSNKLHINKVRRRTKLKSKTPSPKKLHVAKIIALEFAGPSSSAIEDLEKCEDPNGSELKVDKLNRKSKSKTLSPGRTIEGTSVVTSPKSATPKSSNAQSGEAKIKRISEGTPRQINVEVEINLQDSTTPNLSPRKNKRLSRSPTFVPWESNSNKVRMSRGTTTTQTLHRHTTTPIKTKKSFSTGSSETKKTLPSNNTLVRKKCRTPSKSVKIQPESDDDTENSSPLNVNKDENQENVDLESNPNQSSSGISSDITKTRSHSKFSQSTHYDFELPSDEDPINSQEISIAGESAVLGIDVSCAESISPIENQPARLLETTVAINSNELNFSKMSGFSNTDTVDLNETPQQTPIDTVENIAKASSGSHEKCNSDNSNENDELIDVVNDKEMSVIEGKSELGNRVPEIKELEPKCSVSIAAIPFIDSDEDENVTDEKSNACNNKTKEDSAEKAPSAVEAKKLHKVTCLLTRLEDFALAKVEASSSREEETTSSDESRKSEEEYNDFIDGMAEEGEEDTPSEDSNQIVDKGEYIGSSETDEYLSDDHYDSKDSFICDDEVCELLSGDEYDLENEKKQKKERAIENTLSEKGNTVKVANKEVQIKKSRIIRPKDSSSEDEEHKAIIIEAENSGSENSIIVIEDSPNEQATAVEMDSQRSFDNSQESESLITEDTAKSDSQEVNVNDSNIQNTSTNALDNSIQKRNRKTSLSLQENIIFDGVKDPMISQRISTLVESFCSTVTKGEVSLNLSLEYEGTPSQDKEKQKIAPVKVLSNIKICPASGPENDPLEEPKEISTLQENLSQSLGGESGKRRKKLKRRFSKSLSELCKEETQCKRRRKNSLKALQKMKPAESYNLMNQLITDVKNRPKRTIKPSLLSNVDSSWISSEVVHMKPSTTAASREEMLNLKAQLHPKDFKNKLLSDPTRVKRIQTKALLKKKGVFL